MINFTHGNIFESTAEVIVNPVNCVGVMGKGLALEFKNKYPQMFFYYQEACQKRTLTPGRLMLVDETDKKILLFPTKVHWRYPSKIDYIKRGIEDFVKNYQNLKIKSVAFPRLGCGLGGLNWNNEVKPLLLKYLSNLPIEIIIYE